MDEADNVTLTGRLKDVINRGGVKYHPQEVELPVEILLAALQFAIAPVPDERLGERACRYVVPRPGQTVTLDMEVRTTRATAPVREPAGAVEATASLIVCIVTRAWAKLGP